MADDINPTLRSALVAATGVLDPQIRGLADRIAIPSTTAELRAALTTVMQARIQRRSLIQTVLKDLDQAETDLTALEADGYPALPDVAVLASINAEINEQTADLQAAAAVFTQLTASFNASAPTTDTNQPVPNQTP